MLANHARRIFARSPKKHPKGETDSINLPLEQLYHGLTDMVGITASRLSFTPPSLASQIESPSISDVMVHPSREQPHTFTFDDIFQACFILSLLDCMGSDNHS